MYDRLVASALGHGQVGHDYEYVDHGSLPSIDPADLGLIPSQPDEGEADMSAVPDMSTVPKSSGSTSGGESQDNQGFRTNTMLPGWYRKLRLLHPLVLALGPGHFGLTPFGPNILSP